MSDQPVTNPSAQIIEFANLMCDETITAEQREQLESLLDQHPELRGAYLDYLRVNAGLIWRYRTGEEPTEKPAHATSQPVSSLANNDRVGIANGRTPSGWTSLLRTRWAFACALASSVFIACLLWINRTDTSVERIADGNGFVATLREATHAVWSNNERPVDVGSRVRAGTLQFNTGEAELVFDSGAKLRLAGPAELVLESPLSVYLAKGTIAAHMPPEAVGFKIRTPESTLIDQGTEFGVSVSESDGTQVHVFRGQVDLLYQDAQETSKVSRLELRDRQARSIALPNTVGEEVEYSKSLFGSLARRVVDPVEWKTADGGNGHFYQLVVEKQPMTWHEAAQRATSKHFRGMPGHLVTITSSEEDQFVLKNLLEDAQFRGAWMGLTDVLREGHYRWVTGEPYDYTNWASWPDQQPDNFQEADWHGGEDYGMYAQFPGKQPWAWNDLSIDSIHEKISAYLVEYEPPLDALRHRSMALDPIHWPKSAGGNGHYYRIVLVLEPVDWETIRQRATESQVHGTQGHLVAMETAEEREFVAKGILRVCGIPEMMIGLSGSLEHNDLRWVNGLSATNLQVERSHLPTDLVYGVFRWNPAGKWQAGWEIRAMSTDVLPADWFGYIIEYPVESIEESL